MHIRPAQPADLDALYRICLQTGDAGEDATDLYEDPRLLGEIFAAPYAALEPDLAFVTEDEAGVSGFVLGALDTPAFEERLEHEWWPALRQKYPDPPEGDWTREERWMAHIHHPPRTSGELTDPYPSHLHINLLPRTQGQGAGKKLMATLLDGLRARGSRGDRAGCTSACGSRTPAPSGSTATSASPRSRRTTAVSRSACPFVERHSVECHSVE